MTDHEYIDRACWSAECQISDVVVAVKRDPSLASVARAELAALARKLTSAIADISPVKDAA